MWFDISEDDEVASEDGSYFGIFSKPPEAIAQLIPRPQNPSLSSQMSAPYSFFRPLEIQPIKGEPKFGQTYEQHISESPCPSGDFGYHSDGVGVSVF